MNEEGCTGPQPVGPTPRGLPRADRSGTSLAASRACAVEPWLKGASRGAKPFRTHTHTHTDTHTHTHTTAADPWRWVPSPPLTPLTHPPSHQLPPALARRASLANQDLLLVVVAFPAIRTVPRLVLFLLRVSKYYFRRREREVHVAPLSVPCVRAASTPQGELNRSKSVRLGYHAQGYTLRYTYLLTYVGQQPAHAYGF